jgi:MFS family permease
MIPPTVLPGLPDIGTRSPSAEPSVAWPAPASRKFPPEVRALAIALFYAIGTGVGGIVGPPLFGMRIDTGSRISVAAGYGLGALLMMAAAIEWRWRVAAEGKPLETVCRPLACED